MLLGGVILAGGQSRRMGGGDKGLLALGNRPLLVRVADRLAPQVDELVLNANGDVSRFEGLGLQVIPDGVEGYPGPLAGVLAGMDWAAHLGCEAIITAAADTPFFPTNLGATLEQVAKEEGAPIVLAATPDERLGVARHPTFGLWPVALRDDLRAALDKGVRKVVEWTDRHGAAKAMFPVNGFDPFFNVNTPADMERARAILQEIGD